MKTIITITAATLFSASASAVDIYKDLGAGNTDLSPQRMAFADVVGIQPSVGDGVDRFQGFGDGNPDVTHSANKAATGNATPSGYSPKVYVGPGLAF